MSGNHHETNGNGNGKVLRAWLPLLFSGVAVGLAIAGYFNAMVSAAKEQMRYELKLVVDERNAKLAGHEVRIQALEMRTK